MFQLVAKRIFFQSPAEIRVQGVHWTVTKDVQPIQKLSYVVPAGVHLESPNLTPRQEPTIFVRIMESLGTQTIATLGFPLEGNGSETL